MHVVQIWIMHINALKTQLMHKISKRTPKNQKNWHNTPVVLRWHERKFESNKRQWISFRPQRWDIPYRNHHACCDKLWFVRSIYPNLPQMGPSFMNFRWVLNLLQFKNQASQHFAGNQRCPGVWNSLPFLAWDLSMHPRTQIWFFDQFICTGACACSSNLNYAHKCIENSVNA